MTKPFGLRSQTITSFAVWFLLYFSARGLLEPPEIMDKWARVAVALLPIPAFVLFLISVVRGIRGLDELERKIHLEALAIAFPLGLVLLMTLGLLQRATELKFEDWSYAHVWIYVALFYFAGLGIAKRRYE